MNPERRQQIERLYHEALRQHDRAAFLAEACQGEAELLGEIESLLAHDSSAVTHLTVGTQLGPYLIEAPIGAGGMGVVFRAHDTRLHRTVAIKALPLERIADPERKRRFLQEARAASALNHPNIVTLYDIANEDGVDYLVMEFVPGKSLDKLITPKGLPLVEVIGYMTQIANGLAAAHAAGIVHRDIKPANVIVTSESLVKILDFGLAKLTERAPSPESETLTQAPTLTEAGTLMGTVTYMSPEQASAQPLDHRTDIFSLGVMLYEMLAGKRPFDGKSQIDTMHAIIHDPAPPLSAQPPELRDILAKALAKDTRDRYQHAGDLGLDLRYFQRAWESHSLPSMEGAVAKAPNRRWLATVCLAMVLVAAVSAGTAWIWRGAMAPVENPLASAKFARFTDFEGVERDAAISPDGKFVAFVSDRDGPFDIWVSQVGSGRFVNLTQGKVQNLDSTLRVVGFSGDGTEISFHTGETLTPLMTIPLMGGPPRIFLAKSPAKTPPFNGAWSWDGARLVYHTSDPGDPMFVTDRTGGNAHQIYVDRPGIHNHHPVWSSDGAWIFFMKGSPSTGEMDVWRIAPGGGTPERMTRHNAGVGYPSPIDARTVVYVGRDADGSGPWLWALDTKRKVTRRVSFGLEKYTSVAASANGRRLAATVANPSASLWSLPILDRAADERDAKPFPVPMVRALAPRFRGASLFYFSSRGTGDGLWRYRDGQALEIWKGSEGGLIEPAAISADGLGVALVLRRNGKVRLHTLSADGSDLQSIAESIEAKGSADWSPDGKWIVTGGDDGKGGGLFKIPVSGGAPVRLAEGPALNPVWSPEGSLIVYTGANVSWEAPLLGVRPDGARVELPRIQVRREGQRVRFTSSGKGLIFMRGLTVSQDFWLLDLTTNKTRLLAHLNNAEAMQTFDVTPDGKQIVFDRLRENSDIVLIDLPTGTSAP